MGTGSAAFVGRSEELERLRELSRSEHGGMGRLVLIEGDAGFGKTRLIEEWRPSAVSAALEYAGAPYAPVRDLLSALDKRHPRVRKGNTALAAALRPVLDLRPAADAAVEGSQRQVLDAVLEALSLYAKVEPLTLAFEDVHWTDTASACVFLHLARHLESLRAILALTYRAGEAAEREESRSLLAQLSRLAYTTVVLRALSEEEAMLLLHEASERPLPLETRRTICELAQGNPLLLLELLRHAAGDPHALDSSLPVSMQALVHERLARFDEPEREVLRVCAAMEIFDHTTVAQIAGLSTRDLMKTLRKARDAGVVAEAGAGFVFRHALIRRAVTADLLSIELTDLHARIARNLESRPDAYELHERLAYHYWMAGEIASAERYNVLAAQRALDVFAFDDAAVFFERAIGARGIDRSTFELHRRLAQAHERAGHHSTAAELRRRLIAYARGNESAEAIAQLGIELSRSCFHTLDDDGSIAAVRDALEAVGPAAPPRLRFELHALLAWYLVHLRRTAESRAALDDAAALIDGADGIALIRYHEACAAYEVHARGGGDWKPHVERAIELAGACDEYVLRHRFTNGIALAVASEIDDYAYAFGLIDRVQPLLEHTPNINRATVMHMTAGISYLCGRLEAAREALETMLPFLDDNPMYVFRAAAIGIPLALQTGDPLLLQRCSRPRLLEEAFASKDPVVFGPVAAAVAEQMIEQGRKGEAVALVERTLSRIETAGNNFQLLTIAARIGSAETVARALEMLTPWIERSASARAVMELVSAYAASGAAGTAHAQKAAQLFSALPWPLHQARALELADEPEAARAIYAECGALAQMRRLEKNVQRPPAAPVLSKRESEVALLVAEGKSNRAIADDLVLSERTVENHIASIFTKLHMRSRAEIATYVARENTRAI
jgi:DNA-binding NarL/FixJ family response regulator